MTPFLTARGKAALAVGVLWLIMGTGLLVVGMPVHGWPLLTAASCVLVMLALAFLVSIPVGWVLDGELFGAELEAPERFNQGSLRTDETVVASLRLVNRSGLGLRALRLWPESSTALHTEALSLPEVELPAASEVRVDVPVVARRSGRWFIHGFHVRASGALGWFEVRDYVSTSQPMVFLPRGLVVGQRQGLRPSRVMQERVGIHELSERGSGTDLREIREHQHGDPFRSIAWKATARTGRLMVREFDREISLHVYVVLDMSATMRGGQGGSKFEHAIRLCADLARLVLRGNDRCGLITFDERVYGHLPPREGNTQLTRIIQHLMGLAHVMEPQLTEYDEDTVIETLVHYLLLQERLDFRHRAALRKRYPHPPPADELYDVELLNRWLERQVRTLSKTSSDPTLEVGVLGRDQISLVRQYCQLRGVEVPYRNELRYGTKEQGLVSSLETILAESRNPHVVVVVSDLVGLVDTQRLERALMLARARRNKVMVLTPFTPAYVTRSEDVLGETILHELYAAAARRERKSTVQALSRAAVPMIELSPEVPLGVVLKRLRLTR